MVPFGETGPPASASAAPAIAGFQARRSPSPRRGDLQASPRDWCARGRILEGHDLAGRGEREMAPSVCTSPWPSTFVARADQNYPFPPRREEAIPAGRASTSPDLRGKRRG